MEVIISWVAAVVSVGSLIVSIYTVVWTRLHDRKQATLRAVTKLQTEVFDHINDYTPDRINEICADHKSEEYKVITGYFARLEHFCVGVVEKVYDEKTFYKLTHGYFDGPRMRERLNAIFKAKNHTGSNDFYKNTRTVLERMDKRSKISKGGNKK